MPAAPTGLRLTSQESQDGGEFIKFTAQMRLPIAPVFASKGDQGGVKGSAGLEGVREVLAGWVMRYLPPLRCVLLTFSPTPSFALPIEEFPASLSPFPSHSQNTWHASSSSDVSDSEDAEAAGETKMSKYKVLPLIEGSGFSLPIVRFEGMGWRPRIGQTLTGTPTLSTPSHISLLLHNLFNCSIPSTHIPSSTYYFDPTYPVPIRIQQRQNWGLKTELNKLVKKGAEEGDNEELEEEAEEVIKEEGEEEEYREKGWWRWKKDDEPVGGEEGRIEFVVVGLTIANSMISLTGSLLPSPFSIPAAHSRARSTSALPSTKRRRTAHDSDSGSEAEEEERLVAPPKVLEVVEEESGSESSEGEEETRDLLLGKQEKGGKEESKEEKKKRKEEKRLRKEARRIKKEQKEQKRAAKKAKVA